MDNKYCAVIGIDAPSVSWAELETTTQFRYFTGRVLLELDKAYNNGYREFSVCLGSVMDLYLAMEVVGLKKEESGVKLYPYEISGLDLCRLTDYQARMRKTIVVEECSTGFMYGSPIKTEFETKSQLVQRAGRVIAATATYYESSLQNQVQAYMEIQGDREFIEIPLVQHFEIRIEPRGTNGK